METGYFGLAVDLHNNFVMTVYERALVYWPQYLPASLDSVGSSVVVNVNDALVLAVFLAVAFLAVALLVAGALRVPTAMPVDPCCGCAKQPLGLVVVHWALRCGGELLVGGAQLGCQPHGKSGCVAVLAGMARTCDPAWWCRCLLPCC